jgi:hypothetical protein
MPTADTTAHVKIAGAAMGTHAKRSRSSAATMVGFSSWIQRNWSDAQTPMRKDVSAQRRSASTVSGTEADAADESEAEKKNATSAAMSAAQTVKKAPCRCRSASRRYAAARPTARTANTGSPPRSSRNAAAGASAAATRALCANAGCDAKDNAPAARGPPAAPPPPPDLEEEAEGKGRSGCGEEVELRRSWCGAGDREGELVEKVGEESDGEMRRRPWRGPDPEGSMASLGVCAGSRVLRGGLGFGRRHRPERRKTTATRRRRSGARRGDLERSQGGAKRRSGKWETRSTHSLACGPVVNGHRDPPVGPREQ